MTPELLAALRAELDKPAYAALGDAAAADHINGTAATVKRPVRSKDLRRFLELHNLWPEIERIARFGDADADKVRAAISMVSALAGFEDFDLQVPAYLTAVSGRLDGVIAAGLIEASHKAGMLALENQPGTIAEAIGWPGGVTPSDVANARRL